MRIATGRILSGLITAGGWLLTGARIVLDAVGYSTAPEDLGVFASRAVPLLTAVPWWGYLFFALASTMWLMWVSWQQRPGIATQSPQKMDFKEFKGVTFEKKTVVLDYHHYIDCKFQECILNYNGGPWKLTNCRIVGGAGFSSMSMAVVSTMELMKYVGIAKAEKGDFIARTPIPGMSSESNISNT